MNLRFRHFLIALSVTLIACEPDRIEPIVDCSTVNLSLELISTVNASCSESDGSITVAGSGGRAPYKFSINSGSFGSDSLFTGLSIGNYTITIKDGNECTNFLQATVNNSGGFSIQTNTQASNCAANDGSITITTIGGVAPFQFKVGNGSFGESNILSGLAAGNYSVTAKDANGCETISNVEIEDAFNVQLSVTKQDAGCGTSNGSLTLQATGGTSPYQYKIGNGSFVNTNVFNGLSVGDHNVTAKDANGCEETKTEKVLSGIKFSSSISTIISNNCATSGCHNGTQSPNLTTLANIQAAAQAVKTATGNKSMPKNGSLTQAQIDAIACWVNDGAPNN